MSVVNQKLNYISGVSMGIDFGMHDYINGKIYFLQMKERRNTRPFGYLAVQGTVWGQFRQSDIFPTTITSCSFGQKAVLVIRDKQPFVTGPMSFYVWWRRGSNTVVWQYMPIDITTQSQRLLQMKQTSLLYSNNKISIGFTPDSSHSIFFLTSSLSRFPVTPNSSLIICRSRTYFIDRRRMLYIG